jgi:hypothetical protein
MLERRFQPKLIKDIKARFPGCVVLKNDPNYKRGIPDLTILYKDKWAWLETKRSRNASHRQLQDYYIEKGNRMSFARFVNPENKTEVLNELQQAFQPRRKTRVSRSL